MDAERRRLLIGALVVLASLRFLILPWIDQQAEAREQLEVLTQRLDRSTGVVLNRSAITDALLRLEKANTVDRQLSAVCRHRSFSARGPAARHSHRRGAGPANRGVRLDPRWPT